MKYPYITKENYAIFKNQKSSVFHAKRKHFRKSPQLYPYGI